ncbi:MAG TPA: hypothetical protein VFO95_05460 [Gemmatimonadales bacterium]|nr:hypothetical protein [Gemmatimonadales bacterium]
MKRRLLLLAFLLPPLLLTRTATAQEVKKVRYDPDRILADEVAARASDAKTAYDIIKRLRPQFLRQRGSGSIRNYNPVPVRVYVDGILQSRDVSALNEIMAHSVVEISYLNGSDATTRFGTGYENGAILVTTGRRLTPNN